jgi:hypothetical protein
MNSSLLSVFALAGIAGLALAAALPATPFGPLDAVAGDVFLVAGVDHLALAALAVVEHRLGDVLLRNAHLFAALQVADAAAIDRALDRLADLVLVAAQEPLAVADRLVLAGQPPVDDLLKHRVPPCSGHSVLPQDDLRTRRYHSHSSRTCLAV